jgi:hypothetical protein
MAEKGAGVDFQVKNIAQPTDAVARASIVAFRGLKSSQSARQLILVISLLLKTREWMVDTHNGNSRVGAEQI